MEISQARSEQIAEFCSNQRCSVKLENLAFLNAGLLVAEQVCKWRCLPKRFDNWHSFYTGVNRWAKIDALDRVFNEKRSRSIIHIN